MRKKRGFGQKQVALLLGHQTTDPISRYEQGTQLPNLKNALKLGLIYQAPIRFLFEGYFEMCRNEIKSSGKMLPETATPAVLKVSGSGQNGQISAQTGDFCTFEESLKNAGNQDLAMEKARRHLAELIQLRSQKMGHS